MTVFSFVCGITSRTFCLVFETSVSVLFLRAENQAELPEVLPESNQEQWSGQTEEEEAEERNKKVYSKEVKAIHR